MSIKIDSKYCNDETAIDYICEYPSIIACSLGSTEIIQVLMDNGVEFDGADLSVAVSGNSLDEKYNIVKLLLENGVDSNWQDYFGTTVLDYLLQNANKCSGCRTKHGQKETFKIFKLLVDNGASLEDREGHKSYLTQAKEIKINI